MDKIISNYIKYKFIFNNNIKHSSYLYQKVFRSIYGYTQNVTKKNKQVYQYYRKGVIEDLPYLRPGKNCLILPINTEHKLINFFNTGKSTTHNFREKGDYSIEYTIDKVEINDIEIIKCIEDFINNYYIISIDGNNNKLINELDLIINNSEYFSKYKKANRDNLINKLNNIVSSDWFVKCKNKSELILEFINKINIIKEKFNFIKNENNIAEINNNIKEQEDINKDKEDIEVNENNNDISN